MAANPIGFQLFDYQIEGIRHLKSPLKAVYLADAPGLGKTIQSITAAHELGAKSVLVLCPAAVTGQWQSKLGGFQRVEVVSYEGLALSPPRKHPDVCPKAKEPQPPRPRKVKGETDKPWVCMACGFKYEDVEMIKRKLLAQLKRKRLKSQGNWDVIICDEAHFLKERSSNRTGYILHASYGILKSANKVMLLSGTPMLNRPGELFAILRACYPQALFDCPTWQAYAYKFCAAADSYGWNGSLDASGASNLEELGTRLKPFMLMRDESVLGDKLPGLTIREHDLVVTRLIDKEGHIATRRRETGEAKADLLVENIAQVAKECGKLVVFYYHDSVRLSLMRRFPHCSIIKGGLSSHEKARAIERFLKLAFIDVMLVQLGAGGVGLDGLQHCASTAYVAELDWTPALLHQAIGRLRRLGQKNDVTIHIPIGKKQGLDQQIHKKLASKRIVINDVMMHVTNNSTGAGDMTIPDFDLRGETQRIITETREALKTGQVKASKVILFPSGESKEESNTMNDVQFNELLAAQQQTNFLLELLIDAVSGVKAGRSKKKAEIANDPPQPSLIPADLPKEVVADPLPEPEPEPAPAPAPEPEVMVQPEEETMTHEQAAEALKAELWSDSSVVERKHQALQRFNASQGVPNAAGVDKDKLEAYVAGALAVMQAPAEAKVFDV